jgi:UPF0271 protein
MKRIDLNADVGEGFAGTDAALIPLLSSASIACGGHAGDADSMAAAVALCRAHGVAVGAHPSYPDAAGFGRRDMSISAHELQSSIVSQITALAAVARAAGVPLVHVKPHGALYNRAASDVALATLVADAVLQVDSSLALVGLAGSCLPAAGRAAGLRVLHEGFADRRYSSRGMLVPRSEPGSVLEDPADAREQVLSLVLAGQVISSAGRAVQVRVDTICLHGDGPHAVVFARYIRESLATAGVNVRWALA